MKIRRFQVDELTNAVVRVEGGEAAHALRVLRLKVGDTITLFDGQGLEARAVIRSMGPRCFEAEVLERREGPGTLAPRLIVATAAPKGERADWMVEKCAELGVHAIWLVQWSRGEVRPGEGKIARWRRKAVQAAKQAGLSRTMSVEPPRSLPLIFDAISPAARIWCASPEAAEETFAGAIRSVRPADLLASPDLVFVGPEGGLTADERRKIKEVGGREVRLCDPILRVETATLAAAAVWAAWVSEVRPR